MPTGSAMVGVVTHEDSVVVLDKETGEVVDVTSKKTVKYKSGAHYLKVFCDHPFFRQPMPHTVRTLLYALAEMTPYASAPSQFVYLPGATVKKLDREYGLSESTVKRGLRWLVERDAVRRAGRGAYQVNPYLYARGPSQEVLRLQREWDGTHDAENGF